MHLKIKEIAEIVSGYTFRGAIEDDPKGDVFVLQAKNIGLHQDVVDIADLVKVSANAMRAPYFLEYNDILLVSRGSSELGAFRSALFATDQPNVMPSSSVHVIRITDATVLPKYLSLYLNSDIGQKALLQIVTGGSYIQSILIKNLMDIKIPIPAMHMQTSIIGLYDNVSKQEQLRKRKQDLQKTMINACFGEFVLGEKRHD